MNMSLLPGPGADLAHVGRHFGDDYSLTPGTSSIFGLKKTRFTIEGTAKDFGIIALDTYSADPG